ncbi:hypothetical protein KR059_007969 [Drosophila kikkawai]|nr:hypothetical protein KR059_007969 [Drosophila kikkawai]
MTYLASVCAAGLIHLMHNWVLPPDRSKFLGPQLPSILVAIALLDLIYDNRLLPQGLEVMSVVLQRFCEMVMALILLELGINVIWMPVERLIHLLTKIFLRSTGLASRGFEGFWVGCVTVPLSLVILAFVGHATDHFSLLRNRSFRVKTRVLLNVDASLRYLKRNQRVTGMPLPNYAEKLQQHKDAATRRRRGQDFLRHFHD